MRAFYGIVFDDETKNKIYGIQSEVKKYTSRGKFVPLANFHITLKFLGDIDPKEFDDYCDLLESAVGGFNAFQIVTKGIGEFTKANKAMPYIGIKESKALIAMNNNIQQMVNRSYLLRHENFTPHITLARQVETKERLSDIEITNFNIEVNKIALFESKNEKNKLVYEERAIIRLV
ncbi:MAG: RNA 2',3'-cyclic phosphodiesterase [Firmicutes bacterium HGW-Firmicutes-1]|jgi:2'-5' RNA ligase|nr:MAG: RNA 2',3'-cyclic phosphodiesterase [Firmicutes bacterium HGW-Firmicutes-1]